MGGMRAREEKQKMQNGVFPSTERPIGFEGN